MKKIGLVSCYFKNNYGSQLQAYATQKILKEYGFDVETINVSKNKDFSNGKKKYYLSQVFNFNFIKTKFGMVKLLVDKKINKELGKNISVRNSKLKEFRRNYNLTAAYKNYLELKEASKLYDYIVVGSDQLWLPVNVVADYYTLNWVDESVKTISYSTSFGVSNIPKKYENKYKIFLNKIDCISTREDAGQKIIKNLTDRNAQVVCDPTILFNKEEWMEIQKKEPIYKDKYILCYFLGNSIEYRKFAERLKEKTGCKIVSINHCDEYVKYSDEFADEIPYDIDPGDFLNLIRNAEFVCTDSFHGTVFSLINNRKFFCFRRHNKKSKNSTNSRLDSLLSRVNLNKRLLDGNEEIEEVLNWDIDFEDVNQKIEEFRNDSKAFLENALNVQEYKEELKKKNKKHIDVEIKKNCAGCTACYSICPKDAIAMVEDEEGFLYPKVNNEKCVHCGLCKKVCPVINKKIEYKVQDAYVLNNNDLEIRKDSTSGGAFTAIAKFVLDKKGYVFGAAFDEKYKVQHICIDNVVDLYKIRGSKYVQSYLGNCYKEVQRLLREDKWVCFSGTPCQIEGLINFLGKDYEKLVTVDVMCHAVPSPLVWKKYLKYIKKYKLNNEDIQKVLFRDKSKYGFKYSTMTIKSNNNEYFEGVETDPFLRSFFGDLSDRPSCYECAFKKKEHESDFTIWDCFIAEKFSKKLDDDKGTSRMLINTNKGKRIFEEIKEDFDYLKVDVDSLTHNVKEMLYSVSLPSNRKNFFKEINDYSEEEFFNKYFSINFKTKIEKCIRILLIKTGLYKRIKKTVKKILRK